jgi:Mg2+-importing ATPase
LKYAGLNSYLCAEQSGHLVCDTVDEALLRRCEEMGLTVEDGFVGVHVLSFDAVRRRATVALRPDVGWGTELLVTKGAAEGVMACCTHVQVDGHTVALDDEHRLRLESVADALHADGVRVLAVAVKTRPSSSRGLRPTDESSMTLIGYVGLLDEAKASAAPTLRALASYGTRVKVITGDHPLVAARICRSAGLDPGIPVSGSRLEGIDAEALATLARDTTLFARVDPQQKAAIVTALRAGGHTVGYLGDGVNDAPALHAADVGICVDNAVDIARESSDVLLVRKDLATLTPATIAARHAFANIIKYVKITLSSNLGNVCSVVAACAVLPFVPMLPLQILVQNLLFDISQLSLAFDHTDQDTHQRPRTFNTTDLIRFVIFFGAINTMADLATFAALRHTLGIQNTPAAQVLFHTGWFVENLLSQVLAVHLLRSRSGVRGWSWAARPVLATGAGVALLTLILPFTPVGAFLQLRPLPWDYYIWLAAILALFSITLIAGKNLYQRIFHEWL